MEYYSEAPVYRNAAPALGGVSVGVDLGDSMLRQLDFEHPTTLGDQGRALNFTPHLIAKHDPTAAGIHAAATAPGKQSSTALTSMDVVAIIDRYFEQHSASQVVPVTAGGSGHILNVTFLPLQPMMRPCELAVTVSDDGAGSVSVELQRSGGCQASFLELYTTLREVLPQLTYQEDRGGQMSVALSQTWLASEKLASEQCFDGKHEFSKSGGFACSTRPACSGSLADSSASLDIKTAPCSSLQSLMSELRSELDEEEAHTLELLGGEMEMMAPPSPMADDFDFDTDELLRRKASDAASILLAASSEDAANSFDIAPREASAATLGEESPPPAFVAEEALLEIVDLLDDSSTPADLVVKLIGALASIVDMSSRRDHPSNVVSYAGNRFCVVRAILEAVNRLLSNEQVVAAAAEFRFAMTRAIARDALVVRADGQDVQVVSARAADALLGCLGDTVEAAR